MPMYYYLLPAIPPNHQTILANSCKDHLLPECQSNSFCALLVAAISKRGSRAKLTFW